MSRATRKVAGRHAGILALGFGAFELWRNYQRTKAPTGQPQAPVQPQRRRKRWL